MSDPRVVAVAGSLAHDVDHDPDLAHEWVREARSAVAAADAVDPLLPKVRALHEAAQRLSTRWALSGSPDNRTALAAFDAFTPDDLARLGITGGGE